MLFDETSRPERKTVSDAVCFPLLDEGIELRAGRLRIRTGDGEDGGGTRRHLVPPQRGQDRALHPGSAVPRRQDADLPSLQTAGLGEEGHEHLRGALLGAVLGEHQPPGRLVDPLLLQLVPDVHDVVLTGQALLTFTGEVDEHTEYREHLVVLGP